ncbi:altronate dehydratase family protein [Persicobacter diffluens]|uniref:Carbohydrate hydrolase n=1 Tax=Persicobacter diffluens TaxID=981 RepID=A0AAN4W4B6_9BACT|nr:carbohydrate hydrolase [Persicobacter diffluens]
MTIHKTLLVHEQDNIMVALQDLPKGSELPFKAAYIKLVDDVPAKHKFALRDFQIGDPVTMYGILVGKAHQAIRKGERITTENVKHATQTPEIKPDFDYQWTSPKPEKVPTFMGYHRPDGKVGTRNNWLVVPLVFCENRNILAIKKALEPHLGYDQQLTEGLEAMVNMAAQGADASQILAQEVQVAKPQSAVDRPFANVDGVRFLTHHAGCGGTRADARLFCQLLVGYLMNPNVGGATLLSLGCQNAQVSMFREVLEEMAPGFNKPLYIHEQQGSPSEEAFIAEAVKSTVLGLSQINQISRQPASVDQLVIGMECGGSDGFSGISANPVLGKISDKMVAFGGSSILAEFPELNGVEQHLLDRCMDRKDAYRFQHLMMEYGEKARAAGSGFEANPSPGNIKDGLITDAMKSAGAAKKGGGAPISSVLDYTEQVVKKGLNLLFTPGNDVESTTALAGSGATLILFSTGLGTPTGNPATPVIKVSSNSILAKRMPDIIDFNAGGIISGIQSVEESADVLMDHIIRVASGEQLTCSEQLNQDDFIPWRKDLSL